MKFNITLEVIHEPLKTLTELVRRTQFITDQVAGFVQAGRGGHLVDVNGQHCGTVSIAPDPPEVLHLTVNANGMAFNWGSEASARSFEDCAREGYAPLTLTHEQIIVLQNARAEAQVKEQS